MNILILTYGTRGDVQPYIALGQGLKRAGHCITLATSSRFRKIIEHAGLHYAFMNDGMLTLLDAPEDQGALEDTNNIFQVVKRTLGLLKKIGPIQRALVDESWVAAQQSKPDIIVFHPKAFTAPDISEKLGVPVLMALVVPGLVPTAEYPNMMLPRLRLGGWYNKFSYSFVNRLIGLSVAKYARAWRKAHHLPKAKRFSLLHTADGTPIPVIHGFSSLVVPRPDDWPQTASICGYWHTEDDDHYEPSPELSAFLNTGPPPVYVGFGSMTGRDPERLTDIVIEALQRAGVRGILATGWGGMEIKALPESIIAVDQVPHSWLFPRVCGLVHHGGAGTTAAALQAGKASIVIPFFGDQPFWGNRLHSLNAGAAPIPLKKLTVERLAAGIKEITTNQTIIEHAAALGASLREKHGVEKAVAIIESLVCKPNQALQRTSR
ncbi:glycosyltransferase [Pseudidiomarina sp. GXY010]|uniref:Glycosyltransferase n=1 Tax=Pseudidiomarina fusca TaxID=2965078 RepID=A0ABU3KVC2_9GAMM|nr:glycosyltransferase [Pseudidiomarina sp. GXY010]MBR9898344.1 glycosyltransferase family 1 protein [Gammaproteobacteria bacterium]MDT7525443.1 glycosyltransferase [Pseudidiomarina sp. GXY010]